MGLNMLIIKEIRIEGMKDNCITDCRPIISFSLESNKENEALKKAFITVGNLSIETKDQINNLFEGEMKPFANYTVYIRAEGISGEKAEATTTFSTGRLNRPWKAKWITDAEYHYSSKESPVPMNFRYYFKIRDIGMKRAWINITALGIYELFLNGKKVGNDYFTPGFTSYEHQIQYQTHDVKNLLEKEKNILGAVVAGGWAAGAFGNNKKSHDMINQFQSNIRWGGKSNFVDIPTDCPQRDERLGWTGDIAVFAKTACYNFDMSRFLNKWLIDMRSEQGKGGGFPMVIPKAGDNWPTMSSSCWGDSCILVPWAEYLSRGNIQLLKEQYPAMKKYLKAVKWWSSFASLTPDRKHIWSMPYHWGDWCAPEGNAKDWISKGKWIGTAYFANSCGIVSKIAEILGETEDSKYYRRLRNNIIKAYRNVFTDGAGRPKKEFQTGYVLPLYFNMVQGMEKEEMVNNLVKLIKKSDNHLATGFPGTPYLLFALSDNNKSKEAYDLLLQTSCPSWLYAVKAGATTIWERWDALREDGTVNVSELTGRKTDEETSGGMVSFNHYANGAVGDWLYRRVLGIEPISGGYKKFRIMPIPGGNLTYAKGSIMTPFGRIQSEWNIENNIFMIEVEIPVSTTCFLILPDGNRVKLCSGKYHYSCKI